MSAFVLNATNQKCKQKLRREAKERETLQAVPVMNTTDLCVFDLWNRVGQLESCTGADFLH